MKKLVFALLTLSTTTVFAHGGRTDASGCHTEKATGIYHCHNSTPAPAPKPAPIVTPPVVAPPVYTPVVTPPTPKPSQPAPIESVNAYDFSIQEQNNGLFKLGYEGFTLWLDCEKRGAVKFRYNAQRDTGSQARKETFALDKNVPADCQQTSAKTYGKGYDRGHLVPANHLDYSENAIAESNYMTNILPQAANMNRGAWLATEEIIECRRDSEELLVYGGVIYGNNAKNDYFLKSHGIETPESFWKVIIKDENNAIAWHIPNTSAATAKNLDKYLISISDLEKITGESFALTKETKAQKPAKSWAIPKNCDKG